MYDDEFSAQLRGLAERLASELGASVEFEAEDYSEGRVHAYTLRPVVPGALPIYFTDMTGQALQLDAGSEGGRWEVERSSEQLAFLEELARSVVAGRVVETFGPGRSRVEVTLADGTTRIETGYSAPRGCLPVPGWVRRGRRVQYTPWLSGIEGSDPGAN